MLQKLLFAFFAVVTVPVFGQSPEGSTSEAVPIAERIITTTDESTRVLQKARSLKARQESLREEITSFGLNDGNRLMLEETRRTLPSVAASQQRIIWIKTENRWLKLQLLELEQNGAYDPHGLLGAASSQALQPDEPEAVHEMHDYSEALGNLAVAHHSLVENIHSMQTFLDRQLLWVANVPPVSLTDFKQLSVCTAKLGNPKPWLDLARRFAARLNSDPWQLGIVVVLVIASGVTAHRLSGESAKRTSEKTDEA